MRIVNDFPRNVRVIEHCWIPMPDGCRLSARIWLPRDAEDVPVPAILEYIPYRKRDRTRERDEPIHHYFAGHGYAAVRVDIRGSGDSDGALLDEYHEQELDDGQEVIRWLASRPWCTGSVGIIGKSWGGFNALQIASRRPPELKAVVSVCASDDRYLGDAHYMGGCLLNENLKWGSTLFTLNALPPDPEIVGERWREQWVARLEQNKFFPEIWLRHQRRDAYWKRGSISENYESIECAVYAVGGWADAYASAIPRLLSALRCPRKGLVGPWAHLYPHVGVPGPAIGFLQEAVAWWDHWLKNLDTGIMDAPIFRAWMPEGPPPGSDRPGSGRWVVEKSWPPGTVRRTKLFLQGGSLLEERSATGADSAVRVHSPQTTGLDAGNWCAFGDDGELPGDQRADDVKSLVFDAGPLERAHEILGTPIVQARLSSDRPIAMIVARINDVSPDGSSHRVTYGLLNLTHRESHEDPSSLEPGRVYSVRVPLNDVAHRFAAGHRIRLALSNSYWPIAWPAPEPATLTLYLDGTHIELPVREPSDTDRSQVPFDRPESGPEADTLDLDEHVSSRSVTVEGETNAVLTTLTSGLRTDGEPAMTRINPLKLEVGHGTTERFRITEADPLSASAEIHHTVVSRRGEWNVRVESRAELSSTIEEFRLEASLEAYEGETRLFSRRVHSTVPRDLL